MWGVGAVGFWEPGAAGEVVPEFVGQKVNLGVDGAGSGDGSSADGVQGVEEDVLGGR